MSRARPLILNIDDDEAGRYAVNRSLKQAGFDVIGAETGAAGLQSVHANSPDLILLDIRLPDIDGFEVCRIIRSDPKTAGTPVLQMSASYLDVSSRVKGLDNGADAYLTEPVEPAILVATVKSLLRLKRAENSVRQTAAEWQSTFDAIGEGVALLDTDGSVTRANHAFEPSPELEVTVKDCFDRLRLNPRRQEQETAIGERALLITLDPVLNDEHQVAGAVCVVCDVTEKNRFEAQLRQTARLESIGVLAGGIAHDFNNLLTGILGNSSLLLDTLPDTNKDRELVLEIVKASESAADLTRQILAYSGKGRFVIAPVDLSAVALESRSFVRRFLPSKVELTYETASALPPVDADPSQMQQLLMNLIINAAESFGENEGGVVVVSTAVEHLGPDFFLPGEDARPGDYVVLRVTDSGSGMDEVTKGRIFDPFFTTKFAGRGLGLSAVHGILKAHKGVLRLESQLGEGTAFRLYFPVSPGTRVHPPRPTTTQSVDSRGSGTILVIDDERLVLNFVKASLEPRGYEVLLAEDGKAGVEIFRRRQGDIRLVLLDLTMPVLTGEETFEHIRDLAPEVRVVLTSGFSAATAAEKFEGKGLSGFLGKPFTDSQLRSAVEEALREQHAT